MKCEKQGSERRKQPILTKLSKTDDGGKRSVLKSWLPCTIAVWALGKLFGHAELQFLHLGGCNCLTYLIRKITRIKWDKLCENILNLKALNNCKLLVCLYTQSQEERIGQNHLFHCTSINRALTMSQSFFSMLDTKINDFCHSIVHCLELIMKDLEWWNKATRIFRE